MSGVIASVTREGKATVVVDNNSKLDNPVDYVAADDRPITTTRLSGWSRLTQCFPKLQRRKKLRGLLPPLSDEDRKKGKKTLVLDLDETLVHASFEPVDEADFIIPVRLGRVVHKAYVRKRPGVDDFLKAMAPHYEIVVFTASLRLYADPVVDQLDTKRVVQHRLFRESCVQHAGNFVKDLSVLGRDLRKTIIIDNAPTSYLFHPNNALPCTSWFDDSSDRELLDLVPVLTSIARFDNVLQVLRQFNAQRGPEISGALYQRSFVRPPQDEEDDPDL
eukprot:c11999_g2_i1.p1 GENE.c11999_g2_i1~~c11999_g2_i1.p1  ORF type:complete len:276 (-),score=65.45 c11999_g2_i1:539-1366(-)